MSNIDWYNSEYIFNDDGFVYCEGAPAFLWNTNSKLSCAWMMKYFRDECDEIRPVRRYSDESETLDMYGNPIGSNTIFIRVDGRPYLGTKEKLIGLVYNKYVRKNYK